jgi:hypothetical protein
METKQETCAQRIDEKLKGREEDLRALLDNPDSDWGQDDPALSIQKREIVEICLSWGGPADYVEIHLTEGEVDKVLYRFSDWFDTATVEIEKDSPLYTYAMFQLGDDEPMTLDDNLVKEAEWLFKELLGAKSPTDRAYYQGRIDSLAEARRIVARQERESA